MPPLLHALLDRFGALARPDGDGGEVARPFDRRRAASSPPRAPWSWCSRPRTRARRGAPLLARVRGFGGAFDPSAPRVGWGSGHERLGRGLERMLARAGVEPGRHRPHRLRRLGLARRRPPRGAHPARGLEETQPAADPGAKGVAGEYGGGFLAAAVLAASGDDFGGPACEFEPDPELGADPAPGGPLPAAELTLVTSLAAGGAASWLLLETTLMRLAVAIPAYQAAPFVARWSRTLAVIRDVLVVDDGSRDGTARRRARPAPRSTCCRTTAARARRCAPPSTTCSRGFNGVVTLDADGQHLPEEIPRLLAAAGDADLVLGIRDHLFARDERAAAGSNRLSSRAISFAAGQPLSDIQTGFRFYARG